MDGGEGNSVVIGGYRDVAADVAWIGCRVGVFSF